MCWSEGRIFLQEPGGWKGKGRLIIAKFGNDILFHFFFINIYLDII